MTTTGQSDAGPTEAAVPTETPSPGRLAETLGGRLGNRYLLSSVLLGIDVSLIDGMIGLGSNLAPAWPVVYALAIAMTLFGRRRLNRSNNAETRLRWSDLTMLAMSIMAASMVTVIAPNVGAHLITMSVAATVVYIVFAWDKPRGWPLHEPDPAQGTVL